MEKNIYKLAFAFERKLLSLNKVLAKGAAKNKKVKKRKTKNQITKELLKHKENYQDCNKKHKQLEYEHNKLTSNLEALKNQLEAAKASYLKLNKILTNMHLVDSNAVIFDANDDNDVNYVIDGNECKVSVDGHKVDVQSVREHRKNERAAAAAKAKANHQPANDVSDVDDTNDVDPHDIDEDRDPSRLTDNIGNHDW